jgi:acyl-CoA dehydrogenase
MDHRLAAALVAIDAAKGVITEDATKADKAAVFPERSIAALREARLLSAGIPEPYGGQGFDATQLVEVAMRLGTLCGSTAMIWAMHQIQVACMANSAGRQPEVADYLSRAAREQYLIASITTEAGVGGNLRTSKAAVRRVPGGVELAKRAPTVSYAEAADSFLVTARRDDGAAAGDQVLVLATAEQATLQPTGMWDTLGMRGTCSPPYEFHAVVPAWQVLAEPFGEIASNCMLPMSHALWSAVWAGIADDALNRALRFVRVKLRNSTSPPNPRIGWMHARAQAMKDSIRQFAADYAKDHVGRGITVRANALKMRASVDAVRVAELALEVCGMAGYSEVGDFSVSRQLRDLYSGRLMISNDRLNGVNSELLPFGDDYR